MNIKKFIAKVLLIALLWGLYIIGKGFNEHLMYVCMTGLGLVYAHLSILELVDAIFDRKSKKSPDVNSEKMKFVVVWSDENRGNTVNTMKAIIKKLAKEHGVGVRYAYSDKTLEFHTDVVRVRFITKVDEYKGLKYDKAFGFNSKPYAGPLIEYIVEQHDI